MQTTIVSAFVWATGINQYIPRTLSSPCPPNGCKLQAVQCCLCQCSHQPWYCSIQILLSLAIPHSTFRAMICSISFWAFGLIFMSWDFSIHFQSTSSSSARRRRSCLKFDSSSCLPLRRAIPWWERWIYFGQFSGGSSYFSPFDSWAAPWAAHQRDLVELT